MKSLGGAGLISLAVAFPPVIRVNAYWEQRHPEMVGSAKERALARVWNANGAPADDPFAVAMSPYLSDPYRGTLARRFLAEGQTALDLEFEAATKALTAAGLSPGDIDLTMVSSFLPDQPGVGNAAFLAKRLELRGNAWNFESACAGAMVGLQNACAQVKAGFAKRVLVVVSCSYSRVLDETDTMIWSVGDGAAAFVVGEVPEGEGVLSVHGLHTAETCGAMEYHLEPDPSGRVNHRMRASQSGGKALRETAAPYLVECAEGAMAKASISSVNDVDFFITTTPMAWYSKFCASVLGYDLRKTIDTHACYANTGPVMVPTNLHAAASAGRLHRGDTVLLYAVGSVSSRSAAVLRWGDVKLGPSPDPEIRSSFVSRGSSGPGAHDLRLPG
ncbi:MAG: 3-oxoacyl-[acyl-carrier-protein] synthase III C-terminal domain-containing protein [Myxococcaceae bacterium]